MRRRTNIRRMFESNENRNEFLFVKTLGVYLRFGRSPLNLIPPQCGDKMRAHPDPAAQGGVRGYIGGIGYPLYSVSVTCRARRAQR